MLSALSPLRSDATQRDHEPDAEEIHFDVEMARVRRGHADHIRTPGATHGIPTST